MLTDRDPYLIREPRSPGQIYGGLGPMFLTSADRHEPDTPPSDLAQAAVARRSTRMEDKAGRAAQADPRKLPDVRYG